MSKGNSLNEAKHRAFSLLARLTALLLKPGIKPAKRKEMEQALEEFKNLQSTLFVLTEGDYEIVRENMTETLDSFEKAIDEA